MNIPIALVMTTWGVVNAVALSVRPKAVRVIWSGYSYLVVVVLVQIVVRTIEIPWTLYHPLFAPPLVAMTIGAIAAWRLIGIRRTTQSFFNTTGLLLSFFVVVVTFAPLVFVWGNWD